MINASIKTEYKTNYHLELIDKKTGSVKQSVDTHNVILNKWWDSIPNPTTNADKNSTRMIYAIAVGSGTGTPSATDTALFHQLWQQNASSETVTLIDNESAIRFVAVTQFPATSSYVGTLTEVGCTTQAVGKWTGLFTHALLLDAESNPITINKTDTDILIVTVTVTISYAVSAPWLMLKYPCLLGRKKGDELFGSSNNRYQPYINFWAHNLLCLGTEFAHYIAQFCGDGQNHPTPAGDELYRGVLMRIPNSWKKVSRGVLTMSDKKYSWSNTRIDTGLGASRPFYFNYIIFSLFCYIGLPNASIFPSYQIEDIEIGTGDGVKTDFDNPLNYFVQNSEKVYINNVLQTRNVDYTIDYRNNHNRLPELSATRDGKAIGGVLAASVMTYSNQSLAAQIPFLRFVENNYNNSMYSSSPSSAPAEKYYDNGSCYVGWKSDTPFVFEMKQAGEVNTFHIPGWVPTGTITLSSSDDGETWNQVTSVSHTNGTANLLEFTSVTAQYWKIEGTNSSWTAHYYTDDVAGNELFLGFVGDPYISFTNAPAAGDLITMEVTMDRPFKNGNFVIDCSAEMQMS